MFSHRTLRSAQSLLRLIKPQLNAFKTLSNQPSYPFSIFKQNSTEYSKANLLHLHFSFKFSFSSSSDRSILQKSCWEDFASAKHLLTPEEITYSEHYLKMYSNCQDISSLPVNELKKIRDVMKFLSLSFKNKFDQEKFLMYISETTALKDLIGDLPLEEILDDFFIQWENRDQAVLGNLVQKATEAYKKETLEGKEIASEEKFRLSFARAFFAFESQKYEESLQFFEEISPNFDKPELQSLSQHFPTAYLMLAQMHIMKGNRKQGLEYVKKSIQAWENMTGDFDYMRGLGFHENAVFLFQNGEYNLALDIAIKAKEVLLRELPNSYAPIYSNYSLLAGIHDQLGNHPESLKSLQECLNYLQKTKPETEELIASTYLDIAASYLTVNQIESANEHFEKHKEMLIKLHGANSQEVARSSGIWASALKQKTG